MKYCPDCKEEKPYDEFYRNPKNRKDGLRFLCKKHFNLQTKKTRERNIANGKCKSHPQKDIDPRSQTRCTVCLEISITQNTALREKVKAGGCSRSGCLNSHDPGKSYCSYHRELAKSQTAIGDAMKSGIRWIRSAPPEMLYKFQTGQCWLCGMTKNGTELHRDHHHGENNVGWLRGYLCSSCNTKLKAIYTDESPEAAERHFREHKMFEDQIVKIVDYLKNPPYFQLLDSLGLQRPLANESYEEYIIRFPEEQLKSRKKNRNSKYDWVATVVAA